MKSAEAFIEAIERGLSPIMALHSLPNHEPLYIDKIPVDIHLAALRYGWRFLPAWSDKQLAAKHGQFFYATADLQQLRCWARERPTGWILVTGQVSGVFALEVDGVEGLTSLLRICRDDWSWLDTRGTVAGEKRYLFFRWPSGKWEISSRPQIGEHLSIRGEGDLLLVPPSQEPQGAQHAYINPIAEIGASPVWLLDRAFEPADVVDPSRPFPPCSSVRDAWSNAFAVEATPHD